MFATCDVTVVRFVQTGRDAHGAPTYEETREVVPGCLMEPVSTQDSIEARQAGDSVLAHLHIPKTYTASLAGCDVIDAEGRRWHVVGDPQPYMPENTPGPWNRMVDLSDARAGER